MEQRDDVYQALAALNGELQRSGDAARVKFAAIEPDPSFEGEYVVVVTWALPEPPTTEDEWPMEQIDKYCSMVAKSLERFGLTTDCLFRTVTEIDTSAPLGSAIPAA